MMNTPLSPTWTDGLFTGNGCVSATLFGTRGMTWNINKTDVYQGFAWDTDFLTRAEIDRLFDGGIEKDTHFMEAPETEKDPPALIRHSVTPVTLRVKPYELFGWAMPTIPLLSGHVSLEDGALYAEAEDDFLAHSAVSFTPRGHNAFCLRLTGRSPDPIRWTCEIARPDDAQLDLPVFTQNGNEAVMSQRFEKEDETYAVCCLFLRPDGTPVTPGFLFNGGTVLGIRLDGDTDVICVIRTSRDGTDPVTEARREATELAARGFDALYNENAAWWHGFWQRSSVHLDSEPALNDRFRFAQYTLGCTFAATPMPGLSGMAYGPLDAAHPGCFAPYYTHDQNVQIALMGAMPLGYTEMADVMADTYASLLPKLFDHTKRVYGTRGICLPLCLDMNGSAMGGEYRMTVCGSAYSGLILVWAWRYGRDEEKFRDKYYPLLREFVRFYVDMMREDENGTMYLDWMIPPEIFTVTRDDTCTLALLKPCLETCIEASGLFGLDEEEAKTWRSVLDRYPALCKRGDGGWWCGRDIPEDHYMYGGHLFYPFFPSGTDTDRDTALATLRWFEKYACELNTFGDPSCGWSAFNETVTRLRTGGAEAFEKIRRFVLLFGKENGLFRHNAQSRDRTKTVNDVSSRLTPPVIEGTSAYLFMICDALLQVRDGEIVAFPNVPPHFTGGFSGLHTSDGRTVSAEMKDGRLVSLTVTKI